MLVWNVTSRSIHSTEVIHICQQLPHVSHRISFWKLEVAVPDGCRLLYVHDTKYNKEMKEVNKELCKLQFFFFVVAQLHTPEHTTHAL